MADIVLRPIGVVRSDLARGQAPHQGPGSGLIARLEIDPAWRQGLTGLRPGQDLWVIYYFHQMEGPPAMLIHPRRDPSRPLTGLFNTRSPQRPAPLALTLTRILAVDEQGLTVRGLEALDGTPLLDIKPYLPGLDQPAPKEQA